MMTVKEIIDKIRTTIHDEQKIGYTDEVLLGYINDACRVLWRTHLAIRPELLAEPTFMGELEEGATSVELEDIRITKVIKVIVDDKLLTPCRIDGLGNRHGQPSGYYLTGASTVNFYPLPDKQYSYEITVVSDFKTLTIEDSSPFPLAIDDFIYEFASNRAALANEFDMTQETALLRILNDQTEDYLRNIDRRDTFTVGYWDNPTFRHRHRRSYW